MNDRNLAVLAHLDLFVAIAVLATGACTYSPAPEPTPIPIGSALVVPTPPSPPAAPVPPVADPMRPMVTGPLGCVAARDLPKVVHWTIAPVSRTARTAKAYAHDEEPTCDPTLSNLRTQNDHLRVWPDGDALLVAFDRDTVACGRVQVDVDVDGETLIALVIRYPEPCLPPPPPLPPSPPPPNPCPQTVTGYPACR